MLAVLPVRHQLNMAAFEKYMPGIHAFFKEYQPTRPFRFFCNENGIPNILWLDDDVSLYGEDPFAEAQAQIAEVIEQSVLQCIDFVPNGIWKAKSILPTTMPFQSSKRMLPLRDYRFARR